MTSLAALAVVLLVAGTVGLVTHYRAPGHAWVVGVTAFAPYLMLGGPAALILLLTDRLWWPAAVALVLTAVCVATQVPLFTSTSPPEDAATLTVMASNLLLGRADPQSVLEAVREHQVEVLMLEELTPHLQTLLIVAGLEELLPYKVSDPSQIAAHGTGLWSKYPLQDPVKRTDFVFAFVTARIAIPEVSRPVTFAAAHLAGPWPNSADWAVDIAHLGRFLPEFGGTGSAVLAGDLNVTPDEKQFRRLLVDGWASDARQAGAGYTRTFPSHRWFPPLIAIDHVLTRNAVATSVKTVQISGSDHRALVVTIAVPRS